MTALQDLPQHSHIQMFGGEHYNIKGGEGTSTHRINIGDRISGRDLPEPVGIIDRRRNKVDGTDHGDLVREAIDRRIVSRLNANQQICIVRGRQPLKRVRQIRRTNFSSSTAGSGQTGQGLFLKDHNPPPSILTINFFLSIVYIYNICPKLQILSCIIRA
jgi:hypothetical protein